MKIFIAALLAIILLSCQRRLKINVKDELKATMENFLNTSADKYPNILFKVDSVSYYEERNDYICEFHVRMTSIINDSTHSKVDTTGIMRAMIDKRFSKVKRNY